MACVPPWSGAYARPMSGATKAAVPLRWQQIEDWLVLFSKPGVRIPDELLAAFVEALDDPGLSGCLSVIDHDGFVQVTFEQLHQVTNTFYAHTFPTAMLSSHRATLALVKAIQWGGGRIRAFRGPELESALDWLGVPRDLWPCFSAVVEQLRQGESRARGC